MINENQSASRELVKRAVYASRSSVPHGVYEEMERIRGSALRNNQPLGISTMLAHQAGWFVQWKEGPRQALDEVMERVAQDTRHFDLQLIHESTGPRMVLGPWCMGFVQSSETSDEMSLRIQRLRAHAESGDPFTPKSIWRQLSEPSCGDRKSGLSSPTPLRVLVCSASTADCFSLLHWLAVRRNAHLIRRRFAGADSSDVGSDTVEFEEDSRLWRVVCMARHGLQLPLTWTFLGDFCQVVLLFTSDERRNERLMRRVLDAFNHTSNFPPVIGVAAEPQLLSMPAKVTRSLNIPFSKVIGAASDCERIWHSVLSCIRDKAYSGDFPKTVFAPIHTVPASQSQ